MKINLWFLTFIMAMLFTSTAMAEVYVVKGGDTLGGIAKVHSTTVGEVVAVNPIIKHIDRIQIGWKLEIPVGRVVVIDKPKGFSQGKVKRPGRIQIRKQSVVVGREIGPFWTRTGADKYRGTLEKGLKVLGYSAEEQAGLLQVLASGESLFATINHASKGGMVVAEDGSRYMMVMMLSGPGNVITGPDGVIANWPDKNKLEAGKIYSFGNSFLLLPFVCDNPTMLIKISGPPVLKKIPDVPDVNGPPKETVTPPVGKGTPPSKWSNSGPDNWDWYVGAGNYQNRVDGGNNHGHYAWTKFRYRPLWYTPDENSLGIQKIGLGFVGFLAGGEGIAARYYEYEWNEAVIGLTAKVYAKNSDYDFDAMFGRLWNEGTWKGTGGNKQVDDIFLLSAHGNFYREGNPDLFPKFELNFEARLPFNTEVKRGEETNNQVIEANYTQWIYKIHLGEEESFNVSPGVNLGGGYEWSAEDESFIKAGPAFEFSSFGNVVGALSVYNYKWQGDGQWHPISGYISIDGIWRAYQASQITSVSEEELRGIESGSKLLQNPADFL